MKICSFSYIWFLLIHICFRGLERWLDKTKCCEGVSSGSGQFWWHFSQFSKYLQTKRSVDSWKKGQVNPESNIYNGNVLVLHWHRVITTKWLWCHLCFCNSCSIKYCPHTVRHWNNRGAAVPLSSAEIDLNCQGCTVCPLKKKNSGHSDLSCFGEASLEFHLTHCPLAIDTFRLCAICQRPWRRIEERLPFIIGFMHLYCDLCPFPAPLTTTHSKSSTVRMMFVM